MAPPRDRLRLAPAVVVLAALIVFAPSLAGRFVWDDHILLEYNPEIRRASLASTLGRGLWGFSSEAELGFKDRYYRPVVSLAYALQYRVAGVDPFLYHATNVLLHAACAALVLGWLRRRLGGTPAATAGAAVGAALFALHPTRVESVAWVSGCTDLWMMLFLLASLHAWDRAKGGARAPATLALLALAFFSKEAAVVVPALLASDTALLGRGDRSTWRAWAALCVGFVALVTLRVVVLPLGASDAPWSASQHLTAVLSSVGHYVRLVVWPRPLTFFAGYRTWGPQGERFAAWSVALGAAFCVSVIAFALLAWRRPKWRPALADLAWFVVALAPVANLRPLNLPMLVSARFLYLPLLGLSALVARAVAAAWEAGGRRRAAAGAVAGVALVLAGATSTRDIEHVLDDVALFSHERRVDPGNLHATGELARAWMREGRLGRALTTIRDGLRAVRGSPYANEVELTGLTLTAATVMLQGTPDADQETLGRLREFYEQLDRAAPGQGVRVETRYGALALRKWQPEQTPLRALFLWHLPAAEVRARTLDFVGAERRLAPALREAPGSGVVLQALAMALAGDGRWDELAGVVERGARSGEAPGFWTALQGHLGDLRRAPDGSVERARAHAEVLLSVRLIEAARRVLDPAIVRDPRAMRLVELRVRAELLDRRWRDARDWLATARRRFPESAAVWAVQERYLDTREGAPDPMAP